MTLGTTDWNFFSATFDGTTASLYHNAVLVGTSTTSQSDIAVFSGLATGGVGQNVAPAIVDEMRLSTSSLSAAWIFTEYNNQASPSTFFFIGPEETEGGGPAPSSTGSGILWFD